MRTMAFALAVALSGCALPQSPPVRYHTLLPAETQAAPSTQRLAWELLPVAVPAQVDRPQWVVRAADGSLAVHHEANVMITEDGPEDLTAGLDQLPDVVG